MKFYVKQVRVHGFEMWEAINLEGDVIAQGWSKQSCISAAKQLRKEKETYDVYAMAKTLEQFYTR